MQRVLRWDCCYIADNSTSYSGCSPDWHPKGCCSTSVRSSCFLKQDLPVLVGLQNASILTCGRLASAILEQVLKFGCSLSRPPVSYTYGAECFGRFISLPYGEGILLVLFSLRENACNKVVPCPLYYAGDELCSSALKSLCRIM